MVQKVLKYVRGFWLWDNMERTFLLEEALLVIMDSYFVQKQWFQVKTPEWLIYFLQKVYKRLDWSHLDYLWIIVMFLSAVWTLILTAPIHCRGSIGEQVM